MKSTINDLDMTLLKVMMRPQWSVWMKSTIRSNLVFLRDWLKFAMCLLDDDMNLLVLSEPIGMIICLCERPLVVMLILGLSLSVLLKIVLFNSLIFLFNSSGKISLILRIFLIFLDKIWAYEGLLDSATSLILPWVFLPWNLDFSKTSFKDLGESWGMKFGEVS